MEQNFRLSWVNPNTGYQITDTLCFAVAMALAEELKRRFPQIHETLTIHPVTDLGDTPPPKG